MDVLLLQATIKFESKSLNEKPTPEIVTCLSAQQPETSNLVNNMTANNQQNTELQNEIFHLYLLLFYTKHTRVRML